MALARYTFLPWLRRGAATAIATPATTESRARIAVSLAVSDGSTTGAPIEKRFALMGPGDVVGLNPDLVIRTEPRAWVTDFEPNYLAFVEFYDEDFCWRHTPAPPESASHRLAPWLTLIVLAEGEYALSQLADRPLSSVVIGGDARRFFPPADQVWAWAHVQVTGNFGADPAPDLNQLASTLAASPDKGVCRLVCGRRLKPNTAYTAFVVPTFEVGRKAGLKAAFDDATAPGTAISWAQGAQEYPVYYQWYFRTGEGGDFEDLVERIQARPVDAHVGVRNMDISAPGFDMPHVAANGETTPDPRIVGLEGALRSPTMTPIPLAPTSRFAADAAPILNLPAEIQESAPDTDPVIAPPLTGSWHALVNRVDPAGLATWVNDLNLDPRQRAAGGLGARAVQANQEHFMQLAWEQVGDVLAANRRVNGFRFASAAAQKLFARHILPMPQSSALALAAPVFARVLGSPQTIRGLLSDSRLPDSAMSPAFRKLVRPRGLVARRGLPAAQRRHVAGMIAEAANDRRASAAPAPRQVAGPTIETIAERVAPADPAAERFVERLWWIIPALLALAVMSLLLASGAAAFGIAALAGVAAAGVLVAAQRRRTAIAAALDLDLSTITPDRLAAQPPTGFAPSMAGTSDRPPPDPAAAADFAQAQRDFATQIATRSRPIAERPAFGLANAHAKVMTAITPSLAYPRRAAKVIRIGDRSITDYVRDTYQSPPTAPADASIAPVMAYPDIRDAMYAPLAALSDELFVPNLGLVPPNTISLMLTNNRFIESYMAGANHDFARELLWREYPTDCRGSPFRQFWDVDSVPTPGLEGPARAEALKDIAALHQWTVTTALGAHPNPGRGLPGDRIVLVVRGDLLKRYPNTIVYAQRARWSDDPRHKDELALYDEAGEKALAGVVDPNLGYPAFKATVAPDLHFIGFDLTLDQARGDPRLDETAEAHASVPADRLGWFFVLQEMVAEPRLGLDEKVPPPAMRTDYKWDNFAWENLDMGGREVIDLAVPLASEPDGAMPVDRTLIWRISAGATAADVAGILNQKPVLVAWHGRQMLERGKVDEI